MLALLVGPTNVWIWRKTEVLLALCNFRRSSQSGLCAAELAYL